jgi:hypothetical protein
MNSDLGLVIGATYWHADVKQKYGVISAKKNIQPNG